VRITSKRYVQHISVYWFLFVRLTVGSRLGRTIQRRFNIRLISRRYNNNCRVIAPANVQRLNRPIEISRHADDYFVKKRARLAVRLVLFARVVRSLRPCERIFGPLRTFRKSTVGNLRTNRRIVRRRFIFPEHFGTFDYRAGTFPRTTCRITLCQRYLGNAD